MKIVTDLSDVPSDARGGAVTIGNFDGVHRGHQALLRRAVEAARSAGGPATAITFWPHPQEVLTGRPVALLSTLEQRTDWIGDAGIGVLVVQPFDDAFSRTEPEDFLGRLHGALAPATLILGHDFRFGFRGRGTGALAADVLGRENVLVETVEPVVVDDMTVSSSAIRHLLHQGDVRRAAHLLGRPWQIRGTATSGAGRGHTLGYPTVNLQTNNPLLVADGVYGGRMRLSDERTYVAAISVGTNPTFGDEPRHVEAFLLDFPDEAVDGALDLEFLSYIRAQVTFSDAARLIAQMEADVAQIRDQSTRDGWLDAA